MTGAVLSSVQSVGIAASKDDVTPIIMQVALTREGDALRAMATDRYIVVAGKYDGVEFDEWPEGETLLVDPKVLKFALSGIGKRYLASTWVEIVREDYGVWVYVNGNKTRADMENVKGNFPPVMNLFKRDTEPNGVTSLGLKPDFIAKLGKVLPPEERPDRERVWQFRFFNDPERTVPQPVYARYGGSGYELEALVQPSMMINA